MTQERFFEKMMEEEFPNAGFIRRWWQKKMLKIWWKQPMGKGKETNGDFVKQIKE